MDVHVSMREEPGGTWSAETADAGGVLRATGSSFERCLANLRRAIARAGSPPATLIVHRTPVLAGVAEAAEVMGWDKRRVITYIGRGRFPDPIQTLASGRVWRREDVERFAAEWRARQAERRMRRSRGRRGVPG